LRCGALCGYLSHGGGQQDENGETKHGIPQ
jgi:hypothetical protein